MKGLVFSIRNSKIRIPRYKFRLSIKDIRYLLKRYGISAVGFILLLSGLVFGAVYAQNANSDFLNSLDFLFSTNLDARLNQNYIGTFCACFASNFIFLFVAFLLGATPWGTAALPCVLVFKGFGTGLTAGYLFLLYSAKGIGFYLLVLLPGAFLFCVALTMFSVKSFGFSVKLFCCLVEKQPMKISLRAQTLDFCTCFMTYLIMTFFAALVDTAMWVLFAGAFNF